jgi:hypothetical protein
MAAGRCQKEAYRKTVVEKPNGPQIESLSQYFKALSDPRATKSRKHKLTELIVICVFAVIPGAKGSTAS